MLIIFGLRSYARALAVVTLVCQNCGNPAAHRVVEQTRKFTLFFIPLFPVSKQRYVTCTFCAQVTPITEALADQYVAHAGGASAARAHPAVAAPEQPPALQ